MNVTTASLLFLLFVSACTPERRDQRPAQNDHPSVPKHRPFVSASRQSSPSECPDFMPHSVGGEVVAPQVIKRVEPDYPARARGARLVAETHLEVFIRRNGTVCAVRVVVPGDSEIDSSIIRAVRQWRFAPATTNGVAVDCIYGITVKTSLL
jgi:TonB family protein